MNEIGKLWIINVFIQGLIQSLVVYVVKAANDVCFYGSVNLSPTLYVGKEALCSPYLPKAVRALEERSECSIQYMGDGIQHYSIELGTCDSWDRKKRSHLFHYLRGRQLVGNHVFMCTHLLQEDTNWSLSNHLTWYTLYQPLIRMTTDCKSSKGIHFWGRILIEKVGKEKRKRFS